MPSLFSIAPATPFNCVWKERNYKVFGTIPRHTVLSLARSWCWHVCVIMCLSLPLLYHIQHAKCNSRLLGFLSRTASCSGSSSCKPKTGLCHVTFGLLSLPASPQVTALISMYVMALRSIPYSRHDLICRKEHRHFSVAY